MSVNDATPENNENQTTPALSVQTSLSLTAILANGLMFFTALTMRDYLNSTLNPDLSQLLPFNKEVLRFVKFIITLLLVAAALVGIERWKRSIGET